MPISYLPANNPYGVECDRCGDEDAVAYCSYENRYGELCEEALCAECIEDGRNDD